MTGLKYGLALPFGDALSAPKLARLAEESGWDGVFSGDAVWTEDPLIALTACAAVTSHIRLGSMVLAVPLRQPWHIASESLALDRLSGGRLLLGLGMGATWMGWKSFPGVPRDTKTRAEMLDETIDILTLMYQRKPFDYPGKHYDIRLTLMEEMHYPAAPVQQPRIPIWVPGICNRPRSMQRVLRCDGILPQKMDEQGNFIAVQPDDVRQIKEYVTARRTLPAPFDIVVEDRIRELSPEQQHARLHAWQEAGATWWIDGLWDLPGEEAVRHIRQGPPRLA